MTEMSAFSLENDELFEYGEAIFNCLLIVTKGSLKCTYVEDWLLNKGDVMVLNCQHSFRLKSQHAETAGYILAFQQMPASSQPPMAQLHGHASRIKPFGQFLLQVEQLFEGIGAVMPAEHLTTQMHFLQVLEKVWHTNEHAVALGDAQTNVAKSIQFMHTHYQMKASVEQMAQNVNLSVRQYLRIFKKMTGSTPIAYLNQYRLFRAQELLLQTDDSVQKIALQIGFEDVQYFNRLFKKKVGCTPKEYIRLKQKEPRIATLHYAGELLALGIKPIADLKTTLMQLAALPPGIAAVGTSNCDIEKLKDLAPDIVILSDAIDQEERVQIEKFVPTIMIPWDMDPITRLQQIAKVMGKVELARQYISDYEKTKQGMKHDCVEHPFVNQTMAVLRLDEGKVWLHAARFFPVFYEVLQLRPTTLMAQTTEANEAIRRYAVSLEDIESLDADQLYIVEGYEEEFPQWLDALCAQPAWGKLKAVQENAVYMLRQQGIANSIYNQQIQLAEIPRLLECEESRLFIGTLQQYKDARNEQIRL